jgi:hypothetical protein
MRSEDEPRAADSRRRRVRLTDDAHIELGEPIHLGGDVGWLCPAKIVGRGKPLPRVRHDDDDDEAPAEPRREPEVTHTLLVCTGRGRTAADAQADAVRQLELSHRAPEVKIEIRRTDPPASGDGAPSSKGDGAAEEKPRGWRAALRRLFG